MNILKKILHQLGLLCSYLFPFGIMPKLRALRSHFYTGMISRRFASIGSNSLIAHPVQKISGHQYISVGEGTQIAHHATLTAWPSEEHPSPELRIGAHGCLNAYIHISAANCIKIGDNLLTGSNVLIVDNAHGASRRTLMDLHPIARPLSSKGAVTIGNNVWLGNNVCVMPGVTIGDGVIVAANSVVTHDIPSYSVAAGVPARVVKTIS